MIPDAAMVNALVQHVTVSAVAAGALAIVLRRVFGVFEKRPAAHAGAGAAPGCSHCAAGSAAAKKR